jgi:hypothetical protein
LIKKSESLVAQLLDAIGDEVEKLLRSTAFQQWSASTSLRAGDLVIFNNSFLYREGIAARSKNAKYLCVSVNQEGTPSLPPSVAMVNRVNARFKRVPSRQVPDFRVSSLHPAVAEEVGRIGTIVRALVARIGEDEQVDVGLDGANGLDVLRFEPGLQQIARIDKPVLCIGRLDDIDIVWQAIEEEMVRVGLPGTEQLAEQFESAFGDLRESAGRPVVIDDVDPTAPSILASVIERIQDQVSAYANALASYHEDPVDTDAFNELLRIAYNFADGTRDLLGLVVGLSDLKPLVFWLTIGSQSELADRFADLPFAMVGKAKPSFERYKTVISSARNRAFHDVFAFGRPFHVRLPGDAFRSAELRLFQEYTKRSKAGLDFEDKELVELLAGFTRVSERAVPLGFWEKNLEVMRAVAKVVDALRDALILVSPPP